MCGLSGSFCRLNCGPEAANGGGVGGMGGGAPLEMPGVLGVAAPNHDGKTMYLIIHVYRLVDTCSFRIITQNQ